MDDFYCSSFTTRYASQQMLSLFSDRTRYTTWRKLWTALARAQKILGLPISWAQIDSMEKNIENIDLDVVTAFEKKFHHDVMAHIHAFAQTCPEAAPILHLGATSTFVTDNGDLVIM